MSTAGGTEKTCALAGIRSAWHVEHSSPTVSAWIRWKRLSGAMPYSLPTSISPFLIFSAVEGQGVTPLSAAWLAITPAKSPATSNTRKITRRLFMLTPPLAVRSRGRRFRRAQRRQRARRYAGGLETFLHSLHAEGALLNDPLAVPAAGDHALLLAPLAVEVGVLVWGHGAASDRRGGPPGRRGAPRLIIYFLF